MRKLAWFSGGFGLACLLAVYGFGGAIGAVVSAALLAVLLVVWQITRPRTDRERRASRMEARFPSRPALWRIARRGVALCLGGLAAFGWCAAYSAIFYAPSQRYVGNDVSLSGTVASYPKETSIGGWSMTVSLDGGLTAPDVLVYGSEDWGGLTPGDHVSCVARVNPATRIRGDDTTYYTAKGVYLLGYCNDPPAVEKAATVPLKYWPALCAGKLKEGINAAFDETAAPLAVAVVLGDRSGLSDQLYSALSRSGLMHASAVSGLHISFLVTVALFLFRGKKKAAIALIPFLLFYALMAGGSPSSIRAVIMQAALLAAPFAENESDPPCALALALMILLVQNPFAAASVSLQLSFASVAGILLITGPLFRRWTDLAKDARKAHKSGPWELLWAGCTFAAASVSTSLGAMLFTAPLMALYFGQIALLSPIANILVLWSLTLLMMAGLLIGVAAIFLPAAAAIPGAVFGLAAHYARWMALALGKLPFASLSADNLYCLIWLAAVYLVLLVCWVSRKKPRALIPVTGLVVLLAASIGMGAISVSTATLTAAALDVGQGASTALVSGNFSALVDCGGNESTSAGDAAADWFASVGRTRLDLLVLTHMDDDHFNGVEQLFYRMDVNTIAIPASETEVDPEKLARLLTWAADENAAVVYVDEMTELKSAASTITLLPPLGGGTSNESGQFVLCSAGDFDVLITGDADSFVEKMLVKYYDIPDIELLMVGHHGSNNSSCEEFLSAVRPELAVISVGYNSYGHPRQEVLDRLTGLGSEIHRTDEEGTVTVSVRGENVITY